jgi:hypothetical protein
MLGGVLHAAAAAGFGASALMHLATFTPLGARIADGWVLALFAGAFVLLGAMLIRLRRADTPARRWKHLRIYDWRELARRVPLPLRGLMAATAAYSVLNLGLSLLSEAGSLRIASGQLLLFYLIPLLYFRFVDPAPPGN